MSRLGSLPNILAFIVVYAISCLFQITLFIEFSGFILFQILFGATSIVFDGARVKSIVTIYNNWLERTNIISFLIKSALPALLYSVLFIILAFSSIGFSSGNVKRQAEKIGDSQTTLASATKDLESINAQIDSYITSLKTITNNDEAGQVRALLTKARDKTKPAIEKRMAEARENKDILPENQFDNIADVLGWTSRTVKQFVLYSIAFGIEVCLLYLGIVVFHKKNKTAETRATTPSETVNVEASVDLVESRLRNSDKLRLWKREIIQLIEALFDRPEGINRLNGVDKIRELTGFTEKEINKYKEVLGSIIRPDNTPYYICSPGKNEVTCSKEELIACIERLTR